MTHTFDDKLPEKKPERANQEATDNSFSDPFAHDDMFAPAEMDEDAPYLDGPVPFGSAFKDFHELMEPNKVYQVSMLSIDICGSSRLGRRHGTKKMHEVLGNFRKLIQEKVAACYGDEFTYSGDGGEYLFYAEKAPKKWAHRSWSQHQNRAIRAAVSIHRCLEEFNRNPEQNVLGEPIVCRMAVHEGELTYQEPVDQLYADVVNEVVHLQKGATPGDLVLTESLWQLLPDTNKDQFCQIAGQGEFILFRFLPNGRSKPCEEEQLRVLKAVHQMVDDTRQILNAGFYLEMRNIEALKRNLDEIVLAITRFLGTLPRITLQWGKAYLEKLQHVLGHLETMISDLFQDVKNFNRLYKIEKGDEDEGQLQAALQAYAVKNGELVFVLGRRQNQIDAAMAGVDKQHRTAEAKKRLDRFLQADELDRESALPALLHEDALRLYSVLRCKDNRYHKVVDKLWPVADACLHHLNDKLVNTQGRRCILSDARFQAVNCLLGKKEVRSQLVVSEAFKQEKALPTPENCRIAWRTLVLAHPDAQTREAAVAHLDLDQIWDLVARTSTPMTTLCLIGKSLDKLDGNEQAKIFFDALYPRVRLAMEQADTRVKAVDLGRLIHIYNGFPFMVEDYYFQRFDELLVAYQETFRKMEIPDLMVPNYRPKLHERREACTHTKGKLPKIGRLPLATQHILAQQPNYLLHFVGHTDHRIALATFDNIELGTVVKVLKRPDLNRQLFEEIVTKSPWKLRVNVIMAALEHPKCKPSYANKAILQLVKHPTWKSLQPKLQPANPEVRAILNNYRN